MIEKVGDSGCVLVLFFVQLREADHALNLQSSTLRQFLFVMRYMKVFLGDGPVRSRHAKQTGERLEERRLA